VGSPDDYTVFGEDEPVSVRSDTYYRVWTEPPPGRDEFVPHLAEILDCHCDLCNERSYAISSGAADGGPDGIRVRIAHRVLLDALREGGHTRREWDEWLRICKARSSGGRGYVKVSMRDFYATGLGIGMTPGGVGGSARDSRCSRRGDTNDRRE
jgi:hypothetical protein